MSLSMHKPDLKDLPVAVVGTQAHAFVDGAEPKMGELVDFQVVGSVNEAETLIEEREIAAAYVLGDTPGDQPVLMVAGGAGASQMTTATQMFTPIAAESGSKLIVDDVAPLTGDDTGGSNSLYVGMSWIMAGFLFFAVMRGGAPDLTRTRQLLPLVAGWSVGISVWLWFLFDVLIGAVNGHALVLIGCGALTVFATAWAAAAFTRVWGLGALIPVMIVLMLAGVPASGGGLSLYRVPEVFQSLNHVLPLPAAVDMARSVVYFDAIGVGGNLLVIAIWGLIGLAVNRFVVDPWLNRDSATPHAPLGPRYMPEKGPKPDKDERNETTASPV